jgi:hypothetical protein
MLDIPLFSRVNGASLRDRVLENGREDCRVDECQGNKGAGSTVAMGISLSFHQLVEELQGVPDKLQLMLAWYFPVEISSTNLSKDLLAG